MIKLLRTMSEIEHNDGKFLTGGATNVYFPLSTTKSKLNKSKSQTTSNCLKEIAPKPSPAPNLNLNQFVQKSTFLTSATIDNEISRSSNTAFVLIPIKSISSNNILNCQSFSNKESGLHKLCSSKNQGSTSNMKEPRSTISNESITSHSKMVRNKESLKRKLLERAAAKDLVARGILQQTVAADRLISEKAHKLKKSKLVDCLNDKLCNRPGPLELVRENILLVDADLEKAVKDGTLQFAATHPIDSVHRPSFLGIVSSSKTTDKSIEKVDEEKVIKSEEIGRKTEKTNPNDENMQETPVAPPDSSMLLNSHNVNLQLHSESVSTYLDMDAYEMEHCRLNNTQTSSPETDAHEAVHDVAPQETVSPIDTMTVTQISASNLSTSNVNDVNSTSEFIACSKLESVSTNLTTYAKNNSQKYKRKNKNGIKLTTNGGATKAKMMKNSMKISNNNNAQHMETTNVGGGNGSHVLNLNGKLVVVHAAHNNNDHKKDANYQILLQQQQLLLQWEKELKQKYPNATVQFVPTSALNHGNVKIFDTSNNNIDFIDIDSNPGSTAGNTIQYPNSINQQQAITGDFVQHCSYFNENSTTKELLSPPSDYNSGFLTLPQAEKPMREPKIVEKLEDIKVHDLKSECKKRNLPVSGSKNNLVERLKPYEESVVAYVKDRNRTSKSPPDMQNNGSLAREEESVQKSPIIGGSLPPISFLSSSSTSVNDCNAPTPVYQIQSRSSQLLGSPDNSVQIRRFSAPVCEQPSLAFDESPSGIDLSALNFGSSPAPSHDNASIYLNVDDRLINTDHLSCFSDLSTLPLDNICDNVKNGPLQSKLPMLSLREDVIKNQQTKIDELHRELQKSQDILKQQQQLILAAKKVQSESIIEQHSYTQQHPKQSSLSPDLSGQNDSKQVQRNHIQTFLQQKLQQQQLQQQLNVQRELESAQLRLEEESQVHQAVSEIVRLLRQEPKIALLILRLLKRYQIEERRSKQQLQQNDHHLASNCSTNSLLNLMSNASSSSILSNGYLVNDHQAKILVKQQNDFRQLKNGIVASSTFDYDQNVATNSLNNNHEIDIMNGVEETAMVNRSNNVDFVKRAASMDSLTAPSIVVNTNQKPTKQKKNSHSSGKITNDNGESPVKVKVTRKYTKHKPPKNAVVTSLSTSLATTTTTASAIQPMTIETSSDKTPTNNVNNNVMVVVSSEIDGSQVIQNLNNSNNVDIEDIFRSVLDYAIKDGDCQQRMVDNGLGSNCVDQQRFRRSHENGSHVVKDEVNILNPEQIMDYTDLEKMDDSDNCNDRMPKRLFLPSGSETFGYSKNEAFDDLMEVLRNNEECSTNLINITAKSLDQWGNPLHPVCSSSVGTDNTGTAFLTAYSAQDMAELLNSDWFNVDTVLSNGSIVNNQYFDQANQGSVATPPASFASTSLTNQDNVDKAISKNNCESPTFECLADHNWLDLLPSSPSITSSGPTSVTNINGIHQNLNNILQSCESNRSVNGSGNNNNNQLMDHQIVKSTINYQADSTTVDISNSSAALIYSPDHHQSLIVRSSTGGGGGLSTASNSNASSSSSSPFVESCRHDPLLLSTSAARQAFSVSSDCL